MKPPTSEGWPSASKSGYQRYVIVTNFLSACKKDLWDPAREGSFIVKTVGIQALFDILREMAREVLQSRNASASFFRDRLQPASEIDFSDVQFRNASGSGRTEIKRVIRESMQRK